MALQHVISTGKRRCDGATDFIHKTEVKRSMPVTQSDTLLLDLDAEKILMLIG